MRDDAAEPLLRPLPEDQRYGSWHLAFPDGRVVAGGDGAVTLLRLLGLRPLSWVGAGPLGALDAVVKRNRSRLGKVVPQRDPPRRFP